ncbi:MAG: BrnT family toxin [Thermodesulfobacteriota bacterium]
MDLTFDWDEVKARANLRKHRVSFYEGKTVFNDPFLLTFADPEHSVREERYINIGMSSRGRMLVVIHTERGGIIRLLSSRKAAPHERKFYESAE